MNLKDYIDIIENFPTEGISFKDITKLAANNKAFDYTIEELKKELEKKEIEYIIGPEARGFLFGSAVAYAMGVGFIPVRKEGKLPGEVISYTYKKEYGEDRLEIKKNAFKEGAKVAIVDDLLATGGTVKAATDLLKSMGADVRALAFVIELTELGGRELNKDVDIISLVKYPY